MLHAMECLINCIMFITPAKTEDMASDLQKLIIYLVQLNIHNGKHFKNRISINTGDFVINQAPSKSGPLCWGQ